MARYYRRRRIPPRRAAYMPEVVPVAPIREMQEDRPMHSMHDLPEKPPREEAEHEEHVLPPPPHHAKPPDFHTECNPDKRPETSSFIDRILSFLSPFFKRLFGRDPELEDLILAGVIVLFLYDRMKSKQERRDAGKERENPPLEKKNGGLAALLPNNFSDQDLLLLALFYIFL